MERPGGSTVTFTALHRLLGLPPGLITDEMLDQAIAQRLAETDDLDWKRALPPAKGLSNTDFPKDVAAMANSGGGTIVYGVEEEGRSAVGRHDVGELDEGHERSLRSVAVSAISPPIIRLGIHQVGEPGARAVAVVVPPAIDAPHLIFRNDLFGAPIRNDADTVWMRERQLEAMYRARFDERRHAAEALENLYREASQGRDLSERAWMIAVAHPRLGPAPGAPPSRDEARTIFDRARSLAPTYASSRGLHPLAIVDHLNPRPGLRRWVAPNGATAETSRWKEAWISIHHDGSATIATAVGAFRRKEGRWPGNVLQAQTMECVVADLMALIVTRGFGAAEYEVMVGVERTGGTPLIIQDIDELGYPTDDRSTPLARFTPVAATVRTGVDDAQFRRQVYELAMDCVNQGGIASPKLIKEPDE